MLRDLLENFGKTLNQRSRAAFYVRLQQGFELEPQTLPQRMQHNTTSVKVQSQSAVSNRRIELPMNDGTKPFLTRVICGFLDRRKPDVCHEAVAEMSPRDEGDLIGFGTLLINFLVLIMSSRVRECVVLAPACDVFSYAFTEKGGTLFRPVVKQRRQGSDLTSKLGPSSSAPVHSSETPNTMQPPSSIPQRLETPALSLASEQQDADDPQTWLSSMEPQRAIPNIVTAKISTPISVGFSRKPATPISIGSRSSSIPILPSPMPTPISAPSRPTDVDLLTEPHPRNTLPLETTSNDITQSSRIPPPGPLSLSTPQKKRPVSALEPESSPTSSPRKRVRRSQRQTTGKSNPGKKISRGTLTPAPERSPGSTPEPAEGTETETTPKPPRNRSRTKKSPIAYDPNLPGIELDPTVVTMASICVDTGQGRVSSKANEIMKNHLVWKTANRERRAQMVVEMEAKKYGKSNDSGDASNGPPTLMTPPPQIAINGPAPASGPIAGGSDFDYSQNMSASKFNVQVRIGPNGETVVDEESLYVDNSGEHDTHDYTHVEESDTTKFVNSATHSKKLRGSRWSAMETELFYDVRPFPVVRF